MLDFKELEAFVWAVRLGSFRKAATRLHLTQPLFLNVFRVWKPR